MLKYVVRGVKTYDGNGLKPKDEDKDREKTIEFHAHHGSRCKTRFIFSTQKSNIAYFKYAQNEEKGSCRGRLILINIELLKKDRESFMEHNNIQEEKARYRYERNGQAY